MLPLEKPVNVDSDDGSSVDKPIENASRKAIDSATTAELPQNVQPTTDTEAMDLLDDEDVDWSDPDNCTQGQTAQN